MTFIPSFDAPKQRSETDTVFVVRDAELLVKGEGARTAVPCFGDLATSDTLRVVQYLGVLDGNHCYAAALNDTDLHTEDVGFTGIRGLFGSVDTELFWLAARAMHLINWDLSAQYCGACGGAMTFKTDERAKQCGLCRRVTYPRISPAVIAAIVRGEEVLLLNHLRSPKGLYALMAGFVEPGETLEQAVVREAQEEAGVAVKNIRYFGSQPWAFSSSLMVGFTAEYAGGDLVAQASEIRDVGWFTADKLPSHSFFLREGASCSIAWHLLKWFDETHG